MEKKDNNPHDHFFKSTFSRKDITKDYLSAVLPEVLIEKLDLSNLTLQAGSFVNDQLNEYFSDILYTCPYGREGIPLNISFLLEHKSTPSFFPHLQLLRYQMEGWKQQLSQKQPLTPILPIVFYHGKKRWKKKTFLSHFKEYGEEIHAYLPSFDYFLTDMTQWEDEEIMDMKAGFLINALMLFKHHKEDQYILKYPEKIFFGLDKTGKNSVDGDFLLTLFVYLIKTTQFSRKKWDKIIEEIPLTLKSKAMSTYDMILEQGIEQGIEQGKDVGLEIAIKVIELYKNGKNATDISKELNVDINIVEQIIFRIQ